MIYSIILQACTLSHIHTLTKTGITNQLGVYTGLHPLISSTPTIASYIHIPALACQNMISQISEMRLHTLKCDLNWWRQDILQYLKLAYQTTVAASLSAYQVQYQRHFRCRAGRDRRPAALLGTLDEGFWSWGWRIALARSRLSTLPSLAQSWQPRGGGENARYGNGRSPTRYCVRPLTRFRVTCITLISDQRAELRLNHI